MELAHLFLGTQKDNMQDCSRKGRAAFGDRNGTRLYPKTVLRGENAKTSKLINIQVLSIREKYVPNKYGYRKLRKEYNVSEVTIRNIIKRRSWKHLK